MKCAHDLVVVLVRKNQVSGVLPVLAANRHTPNVLFMVNNPSGPKEWADALGSKRVLLGFPGAGGTRQGHVIGYTIVPRFVQPTTFGELGGRPTPRVMRIAGAFKAAGFPVSISNNMDAWQKTHVAVVSPIANGIYMAGGDNYRLARTPEGVRLVVRAIREGFRVLRALAIPVTPSKLGILEWIPEPMLVTVLRRVFNTKFSEIAMTQHANAARDEMKQLADEFKALASATSVPTPAIDRLYTYV